MAVEVRHRRTIGTAQASKAGISIEELRQMVAAYDPAIKAGKASYRQGSNQPLATAARIGARPLA